MSVSLPAAPCPITSPPPRPCVAGMMARCDGQGRANESLHSRTTVDAPLPSKIEGTDLVPEVTYTQTIPSVVNPKVVRVAGDDLPSTDSIDPMAVRIGAALNRLDGALIFIAGIVGAQKAEVQLPVHSSPRGGAFGASGLYDVAKSFTDHISGLINQIGTVVDCTMIGPVTMQRLLAAKFVRPRYDHTGPVLTGTNRVGLK